jgi:hypothetical protein
MLSTILVYQDSAHCPVYIYIVLRIHINTENNLQLSTYLAISPFSPSDQFGKGPKASLSFHTAYPSEAKESFGFLGLPASFLLAPSTTSSPPCPFRAVPPLTCNLTILLYKPS